LHDPAAPFRPHPIIAARAPQFNAMYVEVESGSDHTAREIIRGEKLFPAAILADVSIDRSFRAGI